MMPLHEIQIVLYLITQIFYLFLLQATMEKKVNYDIFTRDDVLDVITSKRVVWYFEEGGVVL